MVAMVDKMKIHLKNKDNFSKEAVDFYEDNFELTNEQKCDIIVLNDFIPIETDKIVARNSTGLDGIVAKEIISLRGENLTDLTAVAELCLAMAIYTMRIFKNEEVKGKKLGIIGAAGRIGTHLRNYAKSLGMDTGWHDKEQNANNLKLVLQNYDIISLNISADESNRGFMDRAKFEMMKDGAIFLNSSRGWLCERDSLRWALESGRISGCWSDFEMGFSHPNLIITPHIAGGTVESRKKTELIIANKLLQYAKRNI